MCVYSTCFHTPGLPSPTSTKESQSNKSQTVLLSMWTTQILTGVDLDNSLHSFRFVYNVTKTKMKMMPEELL